MKAPKATDPTPEAESDAQVKPVLDGESPAEATPEPEPWTPERVLEWNRYYDLYVAGGVLLLIALVACHRISHSALWPLVQAGQLALDQGWPVTKDPFSYTMPQKLWANIPWLFEVVAALLMKVGTAVNATNPEQAFQISATTLIVVTALARILTGAALLGIRRPGPGLWWSAFCVMLALGAYINPISIRQAGLSFSGLMGIPALGGLASPPLVMPQTWGILFLSIEMFLLFRVLDQGRKSRLTWLLPLFLLWANVDESFLFGLFILAATMIGNAIRPRRLGLDPEDVLSPAQGFLYLGLCALVCLVNPSHVFAYGAAWRPYQFAIYYPARERTIDQIGFFGEAARKYFNRRPGEDDVQRLFQVYYAAYLLIGGLSFVLNRRRFSPARFLAFALAALCWGGLIRLSAEFGVVFAAVLSLNGQEWYHDRFGTEGRIGLGWSAFSVGGRLATLTILTVAMLKATTGLGSIPGDTFVSFGANPSDFAFEAADYVRNAGLRGNVLNTSFALGDALIWRAPGQVKTFIDNRRNLFPTKLLDEQRDILTAIREGQKDGPDGWKAKLDEWAISALMIPTELEPKLKVALRESPDWIEFYEGGGASLFGRTDPPDPADLAYFRANRLDPDEMIYARQAIVASPDRSPSPNSWLDRILRTKALIDIQPHVLSAQRWLERVPGQVDPIPEPARCLLAIREARAALKLNPDDTFAFRILATAYEDLLIREGNLLAASRGESSVRLQSYRYRQLITALNYAIQTTPAPETPEARTELRGRYLQIANLYRAMEAFDLEKNALAEAEKFVDEHGLEPTDRQRLEALTKGIQDFEEELRKRAEEGSWGPVDRAMFGIQNGMFAHGIEELRTAEASGQRIGPLKAELVDLLCQVGQAEQVFDLMQGQGEDPDLESAASPGSGAYRQGLVSLLALGSYDATASFWSERALPRLRGTMTMEALGAARSMIGGEAQAATRSLLELPSKVLVEADWYTQLGFCLLEGGRPVAQTIDLGGRSQEIPGAAEMFTKALETEPELPLRPVIAYYLEKLGRPVPGIPKPVEVSPELSPPAVEGEPVKPAVEGEPAKPVEEPTPKPD